MHRSISFVAGLLFAASLLANLPAQLPAQPASTLETLVRGNEQFGRKLLLETQQENPNRNVVVAPLPLTLTMAALTTDSHVDNLQMQSEIEDLFGWERYPDISAASGMLREVFSPPHVANPKTGEHPTPAPYASYAWIQNTLLYQPDSSGKNPFSQYFLQNGERYFGLNSQRIPRDSSQGSGPGKGPLRASFRSEMHVHMVWEGNTFSMSKPYQADFQSASGRTESVEMQDSELNNYLYTKTDTYEAAVLPCYTGTMTVILPLEGKTTQDVERVLAAGPDGTGSELSKRIGIVRMPSFHFRVHYAMKPTFEAMGIHEIFLSLGDIADLPTRVTDISEAIDIAVDKNGIRADADAVTGMVLAGIMSAPEPFYLKLNRPFIFLIREKNTGALMLAGAVTDPAEQ